MMESKSTKIPTMTDTTDTTDTNKEKHNKNYLGVRQNYLGTKENPFIISREEALMMKKFSLFLNDAVKKRNFHVNFHPSKKERKVERKLVTAQYWRFEGEPGFWPKMDNRLVLVKEGTSYMYKRFPQLHGLTVRFYFNLNLELCMIITVPPIIKAKVSPNTTTTVTIPSSEKGEGNEDDK